MTRDRPEIDPRPTRDRPEIDPRLTRDRPSHRVSTLRGSRSTRDRPETGTSDQPNILSPKPRQPKIDRYRPDSPPRYSTAGGFLSHRVFTLRGPRSTRDRPETGTSDQPNILCPKAPSLGDPSPLTPSVRVLRESPMGSGGGGAKNEQGRLGRGGSILKTADRGGVFSHRVFTLRVRIGAARG